MNVDIGTTESIKQPSVSLYTPIPKHFTSVANHPKFTNLKCWNCDLNFDTYPCFIPTNLEYGADGRIECGIEGNFHSWNCAASGAKSTRNKVELGDALAAIKLVAALFGVANVSLAPSKILRKEYCGDDGLTREEYLNYKHGHVLTGYYIN